MRPAPPGFDAILPELLVGEYPRVEDMPWLQGVHDVAAIVSLQDDADLASKRLRHADLEAACAALGLAFARLPVADGDVEALAARIPEAVAAVHVHVAAGRRVYLHCNAGYNRAPTVAIAYLHEHHALRPRGRVRCGEAAPLVRTRTWARCGCATQPPERACSGASEERPALHAGWTTQ